VIATEGESRDELQQWIDDNMTSDPANALWDNRERAARFAAVARDGSVVVKANGNFTAYLKVLAYHVGALYSATRGHRPDAVVSNQELVARLGLPEGTVKPKVKELRDSHMTEAVEEGRHVLPLVNLQRALDELEKSGG